ncbi:MAG TPA: SDR family oxidoreductase [Solirubrobacteraceae bacterium]|jgi:long-chain acyl-CoA synthetase|nr:SDR family oxidoreductase [Solirubrobacteraceae bacterium]
MSVAVGPAPGLPAAPEAPAADGVLMTGATGFVGMELLARYLQLTERRVFLLVRASDDEHARERVRETLRCALGSDAPWAGRVRALAGDITRDGLGLQPDVALQVAGEVSEIVHGAASVSFDLELSQSRAINVAGTRRMLAFAELCRLEGGLRRFTYVSTAYVAGLHRGRFGEDDLDVGQRFRNPYEQSKFEAELVVREHAGRLPITVVRPSIIVGDRHSGWTASFNVLYWPLRALAKGAYPVLPARRGAPVDVVSVDYVADAIVALAALPEARGATYHLTASADASSIGELLALAVARFGCKRPPLISPRLYRRVLHPLLCRLRPRRRRFLRATQTYLPYFEIAVTYDNARARAALAPAIAPAPLGAYFDALVDYALLARWGAAGSSRAAAGAARALAPPRT